MTTSLTQKTAIFALSTLTLAVMAQTSHAETVNEAVPETTLPTIVVTATRSPTLLNNTIAQTTVIDETDLQRYRGQSVLDVIRGQTGFSLKQSGGDGTQSNFYLRGFNSKQILVMIDGIRYSSLSAGGAALGLLPADQIDRIEILQGASGSSLYGSDAMGGVIQVFTKGQHANQSNVAVTLGVGTQDSYKAQISGQYVENATTLSLGVGYDKTNGINAIDPSNTYNYHPDKDGFESKNASFVAKHRFNPSLEAGITGLYADSTTDIDSGLTVNNAHADQKNGSVAAFANFNQDKLSANLKYGQSFDKATTYDGASWQTGRLDDVLDTKQQQATLQLGYQLPVGKLLGGYEYLKQSIDSSNAYTVTHRDIHSGFVGYQLTQPKYDLQFNVRNDDNSQYGNKTTYYAGGAYRLMPHTRIGASYATNFRAPTFNDLYWPGSENPNLRHETSDTTEVFIEHRNALHSTRLTAYQSDVKDKLAWVTTNPVTYAGQMQNIDKVDIQGVNLTSDWHVNNWLFGGSYDHLVAEDKKTDKQLPYQAKDKAMAYIGYQQPSFDIRIEAEHSGERFTNVQNTKSLDDYTLLNVSGNYYVNPHLTISSRLNNLTDEDYQTADGYRQKGVNAFISATYQWF